MGWQKRMLMRARRGRAVPPERNTLPCHCCKYDYGTAPEEQRKLDFCAECTMLFCGECLYTHSCSARRRGSGAKMTQLELFPDTSR